MRDLGSIPGLGRSPGEGHGNPHQYSCLEYPQRSLGTEEPGGLQSMGSQRIGHDWATKHSAEWGLTHPSWWVRMRKHQFPDKEYRCLDDINVLQQLLWRKQNRLYLESRTPSWAGLWTLSYMPSIYGNNVPTGKPGPRKEEPQGSPCLKEYPNYLCNQIEPYILLCLLGYDHKPIDNCPLLTT